MSRFSPNHWSPPKSVVALLAAKENELRDLAKQGVDVSPANAALATARTDVEAWRMGKGRREHAANALQVLGSVIAKLRDGVAKTG